mmetsp:Transcript_39839/g.84949  ORF Transcript_39839/g.84949 Transcript_39839/m.84949 type:complete len:266 (-) Transcript_39839:1443-2240(-)
MWHALRGGGGLVSGVDWLGLAASVIHSDVISGVLGLVFGTASHVNCASTIRACSLLPRPHVGLGKLSLAPALPALITSPLIALLLPKLACSDCARSRSICCDGRELVMATIGGLGVGSASSRCLFRQVRTETIQTGVRRSPRARAPFGGVGQELAHLLPVGAFLGEQLLHLRQWTEVSLDRRHLREDGMAWRGLRQVHVSALTTLVLLLRRPAAQDVEERLKRRVRLDGDGVGVGSRDAVALPHERRHHRHRRGAANVQRRAESS